jgi:prevent-host-death family protein
MRQINIHEAKTHLSRLVEEAANGAPFVIAKAGRPVAMVVPLDPPQRRGRRLGLLNAEMTVPEDFDTMVQDDIIRMFEGGE